MGLVIGILYGCTCKKAYSILVSKVVSSFMETTIFQTGRLQSPWMYLTPVTGSQVGAEAQSPQVTKPHLAAEPRCLGLRGVGLRVYRAKETVASLKAAPFSVLFG